MLSYSILYRFKWLPITHIERNSDATRENEIYEIDHTIGTQKKIAISHGIISGIYMGLYSCPLPLPLPLLLPLLHVFTEANFNAGY